MKIALRMLAAAGLAVLAAGVAPDAGAAGGNPNGRPGRGRSELVPSDGGPDADATGRVEVKHFPQNRSRDERSWFRVKVRHLDASTEYTLWADDPSTPETDLVQFDSSTTNDDGNFNYAKDTKRSDALPFGATLADLGGKAIEVRDAGGTTTLLAGTVPSLNP